MLKNFENLVTKWLRKGHCNHGWQGSVKMMFYFYLKNLHANDSFVSL